MDSMVGYRNDRYRYFGTAAAKTDDVLNWIPARVSAWLMILTSQVLGYDGKHAKHIYLRDRRNHASPNSAHTEAACAGALHIQLGGDAFYFGKLHQKPTIGDAERPITYAFIPLPTVFCMALPQQRFCFVPAQRRPFCCPCGSACNPIGKELVYPRYLPSRRGYLWVFPASAEIFRQFKSHGVSCGYFTSGSEFPGARRTLSRPFLPPVNPSPFPLRTDPSRMDDLRKWCGRFNLPTCMGGQTQKGFIAFPPVFRNMNRHCKPLAHRASIILWIPSKTFPLTEQILSRLNAGFRLLLFVQSQ